MCCCKASCSLEISSGPPSTCLISSMAVDCMISFTRAGSSTPGKLHQNLILAQSVLLNHRFAHAQLVDAIADGLDGQGDGAILEIGQGLRLHGESPGIVRARIAGHIPAAVR